MRRASYWRSTRATGTTSGALELLKKAEKGESRLLSTPAVVELQLLLRSRGLGDEALEKLFEALSSATRLYTKLGYAHPTLESAALASRLRRTHPELTFFDSQHAAIAIANDLEYGDLDPAIKSVTRKEHSRA